MKNKKICALITFALITTSANPALADSTALPIFPTANGVVTIVNNFSGTNDTITFDGRYFSKGDLVRVYSDSSMSNEIVQSGTNLTYQTFNDYQDDIIISVPQLDQISRNVYVTLSRNNVVVGTTIAYDPEVNVINNVDKLDTVTFKGLKAKDIAKVYALNGTTLLGQATAKAVGDVTVTLSSQLSENDKLVKVTVTSNGIESSKTSVSYSSISTTDALTGAISTGGKIADILVSNNANVADTVTFLGLKAKDTAKVYATNKTTLLGQATAAKDGNLVVTLTNQLNESTKLIYVTVKRDGQLESLQTAVQYVREVRSITPDATKIVVTNNSVGTADTVVVPNLVIGDIVKVYSAATAGTVLGTATAKETGSVTVNIPQLGKVAGNVYVTVTSKALLESDRSAAVAYSVEAESDTPDATKVVVTNNAVGTTDTVVVPNLAIGDIVKVYSAATAGTVLGTGTATVAGPLTVSIAQIGLTAGSVYVSVKSKDKLESDRSAAVAYNAEGKSDTPDATKIVVTNKTTGTPDTVVVPSLAVGDIVKVYSAATAGTVIGTATAKEAGAVTVTIPQLGTAAGSVFVSVTSKALHESDRSAAVSYSAEAKSDIPDATKIVVTNNAVGTVDTVVVQNLAIGDIVKVYSAATAGTVRGTGTAKEAGSLRVNIAQIGATAGSVYISVKSKDKLESDRIAVVVAAEAKSATLDTNQITIANYANVSDVIIVKGLLVGDIIKVYSVATGGTTIATSTAVATGKSINSFNIKQLGAAGGTVYLSVKSTGKLESDRTAVIFTAEP